MELLIENWNQDQCRDVVTIGFIIVIVTLDNDTENILDLILALFLDTQKLITTKHSKDLEHFGRFGLFVKGVTIIFKEKPLILVRWLHYLLMQSKTK